MKNTGKYIAWLLLFSLIICSTLSGCGSDEKSKNTITQGEWLAMINETFGMYNYDSETPHIKEVKKNNPYFRDVQIAYEWGLIDEDSFDIDESINKGFVSKTLVEVVGEDSTKGMSADQLTQFANQEGYVTFSYEGKGDGKRTVNREDAIMSLGASKEKWLHCDYGKKEVLEAKEGVANLPEEGLTALDCNYDPETDCLVVPEEYAKNLSSGSAYIAPAMSDAELGIGQNYDLGFDVGSNGAEQETNNETDSPTQPGGAINGSQMGINTVTAHKVDNVEYKDGYAYIYNADEDVDIEEVVEELEVSASNEQPDFSVMPVIDAAGNRIYAGDGMSQQTYKVYMDENGNPVDVVPWQQTASSSIKVDGVTVTLNVGKDNVSAELKYSEGDVTLSAKDTIKNISSDYKLNILDLNNAKCVVHFDNVMEQKAEVKIKKEGLFAPEYSNGNGGFLSNFSRAILKDSKSKGAKSIKICSLPLVGGGPAYLGLDVRLKFEFDGTISLETTTSVDIGIKCNKGKPQIVHNIDREQELTVKTNLKALIYGGLNANLLGKNIIGVGLDFGIGCDYEQKMYLANEKNELLESCKGGRSLEEAESFKQSSDLGGNRLDICCDLQTYWIATIGLDSSSVIGKKLKNASIDILNKENARIEKLSGHWEDGKNVGDKCTRKYNETEETENLGIGELLFIDKMSLNLQAGQTDTISVNTIPEGYTLEDVRFVSSDETVATVSANGTVQAVGAGRAEITVEIPDTSYKVTCTVGVKGNAEEPAETFVPLPDFTYQEF